MAYSQLEVASSFSCVLKDQKRRERCNTMASAATQAVFQKNLKELVRDHLCISVSSVPEEENSQNHQNLTCITNFQEDDNKDMNAGKQAMILDRWAAKQAEEMVSTIEESSSLSSSEDNNSQKPASSLVQMWEARLHPAHIKVDRCNSHKNSPKSALAPSTTTFVSEIIHPPEPKIEESRSSSSKTSPSSVVANDDLHEPNNEIAASTSKNEDIVAVNNEMIASSSSSTRTSGVCEDLLAGCLDAGERERVRIADIIKRLKCENAGNENEQGSSICDPSPRRSAETAADPNTFSLVVNVNSLKIRGRQAFNDLLVQMEQERKRELNSILDRHTVAKFPHRGRIQSMLRVRSLERGMAIQNRQREQYQSAQCTTPSHANRSHRLSLRERFSRGIGDDATSSLTPRSGKEIENSIVINENQNRTTLLHQVIKSNHCGDISVNNHQAATTPKSCKEKCIIVDNKNDSTLDHVLKIDNNPGISSSSTDQHQQQVVSKSGKEIDNCTVNSKHGSTRLMKTSNCRDFCTSEQQADSLSQTSEVHDDVHEESSARSDVTWQGTSSEVHNFGAGEEAFESMDNWEGNEQDFGDTNYDWFADIARPRSYWEDLRKGWYEEMLTCSSEDNEIKQLLQRKTVSSFLGGEFRTKMDQMIMSHVQIQASQEEEELQDEGQERMGQLIMSFLQRQSHPSDGDHEEPREDADADADADDEEDGDDDEEECVEDEQAVEEGSENPQSAYSSWYQQVSVDDSEQVSQPSLRSETSIPHQEVQVFPAPSTETDLRGQMEQLQREMYELRKAMQAYLQMQTQMHSSVKEVAVQPEPANYLIKKERKCCICYDKQVDTFLYRCGHMCTCLRCAHELQWSSGKCPICRAPILDVVRAYMDT